MHNTQPAGGQALTSSPPRSLFGDILHQIRDYALAIVAAGAAVVGIFTFGEEQLRRYDFTQPHVLVVTGVTLAIIVLGIAVPRWRARRREAWLVRIGEGATRELLDDYRLSPRTADDHDAFKRGDGAHKKVLQWVIDGGRFPFLFLTGRSGVGKSSLLSAYVIPELKTQDAPFVVVEARGYADPLGALLAALRESGTVWDRPPEIDDPREALARAARYLAAARLLVVIDQFEEFLILNDAQAQAPLRAFLGDLEEDPVAGAQILFSARSDKEYLAQLHDLALGRMTVGENWFVVDGFEPAEARLFLEGSGLAPSEKRLTALLREARDLDEQSTRIRPIVLNLMGIVLKRLAGGEMADVPAGGAARSFLEDALRRDGVREIGPRLLGRLITDAGTKRPMREDALEQGLGLSPGAARGCLGLMSRDGLVRAIDRQTRTWEVSHDFVARLLGQLLGRLRPRRRDVALKVPGPVALGLWLVAAVAAVPVYYEILLPQEIRKNGIDLRRVDDGWTVAITRNHTPMDAALSEVDRVLPLLRRLGGITEMTVANQFGFRILPLEGFEELSSLMVVGNPDLIDLKIPELDALRFLVVSTNNSLGWIEIPKLDAIVQLEVKDNEELRRLEIPKLDALLYLRVEGNDSLEKLVISKLDALQTLEVNDNVTLEVLEVPKLDELTRLTINTNRSLRALKIPEVDALISLDVTGNNSLRALDIPKLGTLTSLRVSRSSSLELLEVPTLAALTSLEVSDNGILQMLRIPTLAALTSLEVSGNDSLQRMKIPTLDKLESLVVSYHDSLQALEIPKLEALTALAVSGNPSLHMLEIPKLNSLTSLTVTGNNSLWALKIPTLDALTSLVVAENGALLALRIPMLDALTSITVANNDALVAIEISKLDALTSLMVADNDALLVLEIPKLDALTGLSVNGNDSLQAFEIPTLDALTGLVVSYNDSLEALEIPKLEALTALAVSDNPSLHTLEIPNQTLKALADAHSVSVSPEAAAGCPAQRLEICVHELCSGRWVACRELGQH